MAKKRARRQYCSRCEHSHEYGIHDVVKTVVGLAVLGATLNVIGSAFRPRS